MSERICYKKPFLKEVIFRVDFPSLLKGTEKGLSKNISKSILKNFPISEPRKAHSQEFQFSGGANIQTKTTEVTQWVFHGRQREKTLTVMPEAYVYSNRKYETYEGLVEDVNEPLKQIFEGDKDLTAGRVGLRFVNVIELEDDSDPLSWNEYINEEMLGIFDFTDNKDCISRVFHILEYNYEGLCIKCQFGIANPDYPAPVKKKQFILDIDAYSNGALEYIDLMDFIPGAHERIQEMFEKSITNKTRELMEPVRYE